MREKCVFFFSSNGKKKFQFGMGRKKTPTLQGKELKISTGAGGTSYTELWRAAALCFLRGMLSATTKLT